MLHRFDVNFCAIGANPARRNFALQYAFKEQESEAEMFVFVSVLLILVLEDYAERFCQGNELSYRADEC